MAKQTGIIILEGPIGEDVCYIHPKFGPLRRRKTSVNAERIRMDAAFARVRENNSDFAHGAALVKSIRAAFRAVYASVADRHMTSRLTSAVTTAIRTDATHIPGKRSILHGDITPLLGVEFNKGTSFSKLLRTPYSVMPGKDRNTTVTSFTDVIPAHHLYAPKSASHYRVVSSVAYIDPATGNHAVQTTTSEAFPAKGKTPMNISLTNTLAYEPGTLRLHVLGIEFMQETNGCFYPLTNKAFHALTLVGAEIVPTRVVRKIKKRRTPRPMTFLQRFFRQPVDRAGIPRGRQSTPVRDWHPDRPKSPPETG
ncbi:hypothetical protein KK062_24820 [Fulvivirgaceae bacterium PWU5]|uniref:Uncharacterized protein n=1 Tax=Dawidia cretensis TaxID=2782350 RepID=A0AAP2E3M1_9BACT|nr:hypothetical protein [Dawidia cretensis]MBT1711489.1 hypothetical protein [Dawidia cretensis]